MADVAYSPQHFKPGEAPPKRGGGILVVYGHPSVGKTRFCINTWDVDTPLYFANFDRDASHLLSQYQGTGGVYYDEFTALTPSQALSCLDRLTGMKNAAMSKGEGVFVLDNFLACYELVILAKYDSAKMGAMGYGPVNLWLRDFMLGLERAGIWCLLTAPSKEVWISIVNQNTGNRTGQATGTFDPDGWFGSGKGDYHMVGEVWLYTNRKMGAEPNPVVGQVLDESLGAYLPALQQQLEFYGKLTLSKKRPAVEGVILKNPSLYNILKLMKEIE